MLGKVMFTIMMKLQCPRFPFPGKNRAPIRGIKYYKEIQSQNRVCILFDEFIDFIPPNIKGRMQNR